MRVRRWFRRGCLGLTAVYGLISTTAVAIWLMIGERLTLVSMLVAFLSVLLLLALLFLPLLLLLKRWRLSLLLVTPFVTFLLNYGMMFLPRSVSVPPDDVQIHLLTYNLHAEHEVLTPVIDIIRQSGADMVAVQEMSGEMAAAINTELADVYPYRLLYPEPGGGYYHGRGFLSRYPVVENHAWPVTYPIPLRLQRLVVLIHGTRVTVYNFHAAPSQPIYEQGFDVQPRTQQIQDLLAMIGQETNPLLLMCDCNTYDLDQNYRRIIAVLHDTYREVGWGMGYTNPDWSTQQGREGPAFIPLHQRPDYIFHNDAFLAVEAMVWPESGGSDHRPLYAVLALKND
jgi:vancomycin resistance protein VanJ